jgi:hypothetical protein
MVISGNVGKMVFMVISGKKLKFWSTGKHFLQFLYGHAEWYLLCNLNNNYRSGKFLRDPIFADKLLAIRKN